MSEYKVAPASKVYIPALKKVGLFWAIVIPAAMVGISAFLGLPADPRVILFFFDLNIFLFCLAPFLGFAMIFYSMYRLLNLVKYSFDDDRPKEIEHFEKIINMGYKICVGAHCTFYMILATGVLPHIFLEYWAFISLIAFMMIFFGILNSEGQRMAGPSLFELSEKITGKPFVEIRPYEP